MQIDQKDLPADIVRMCEHNALDLFLSDYNSDRSFDEVIGQLLAGDLLVWEPFENHDPELVAEFIEDSLVAHKTFATAVINNLLVKVASGDFSLEGK